MKAQLCAFHAPYRSPWACTGWIMDLYGIKIASIVANVFMVVSFSILAATAGGSIGTSSVHGRLASGPCTAPPPPCTTLAQVKRAG